MRESDVVVRVKSERVNPGKKRYIDYLTPSQKHAFKVRNRGWYFYQKEA